VVKRLDSISQPSVPSEVRSWPDVLQEILSRRISQEEQSSFVSSSKRKLELESSPPEAAHKKIRLEVIPNSLPYESNDDFEFKKPSTSQVTDKSTPVKSSNARLGLDFNPEFTSPFQSTDYDTRACDVTKSQIQHHTSQDDLPSSLEPNEHSLVPSMEDKLVSNEESRVNLDNTSAVDESESQTSTSLSHQSQQNEDYHYLSDEEISRDQDEYSIQLDAMQMEAVPVQESFASVTVPSDHCNRH
jgi:hypothetical protein